MRVEGYIPQVLNTAIDSWTDVGGVYLDRDQAVHVAEEIAFKKFGTYDELMWTLRTIDVIKGE